MSLTTSWKRKQPLTDKEAQQAAIVELTFAGHAIAQYLHIRIASNLYECVCGKQTANPTIPGNHAPHCPVGRFYAAADEAKEAVR